jgi:hypothetical protein
MMLSGAISQITRKCEIALRTSAEAAGGNPTEALGAWPVSSGSTKKDNIMNSKEQQHGPQAADSGTPAGEPTPSTPRVLSRYEGVARDFTASADALISILPEPQELPGLSKRALTALGNVPVPFLRNSVVAAEQNPELGLTKLIDVEKAYDTIDLIEVMPQLRTVVDIISRRLDYLDKGPRALLAIACRDAYAVIKRFARNVLTGPIAAHAQTLKVSLNKKGGRPKSQKPNPAPAPAPVELKEAA